MLIKNVILETNNKVNQYDVFDGLLQQFQDRVVWDTIVVIHHILEDIEEQGKCFIL
jgi:hypothetical protein